MEARRCLSGMQADYLRRCPARRDQMSLELLVFVWCHQYDMREISSGRISEQRLRVNLNFANRNRGKRPYDGI
jgi:hypothetical protein